MAGGRVLTASYLFQLTFNIVVIVHEHGEQM